MNQNKDKQKQIHNISYIYETDFFTKQEVNEINQFLNQNYSSEFILGDDIYENKSLKYRHSLVNYIDNKDYYNVKIDKLIEKVEQLNQKYFQFDITDLTHIQHTLYNEEGHHFDWHPDDSLAFATELEYPDNMIFRKLTLVVCFDNHENYQGGEFQLFVPSSTPDQGIHEYKMTSGDAILFPSFLMHKVMPITAGSRRTFVCWFMGPRWR